MRTLFIKSLIPIICLEIISIFLSNKCVLGQSRETLIKAGYIEKFTHFTQWPVTHQDNEKRELFLIGIMGENPFGQILEEIFSKSENIQSPVIKNVDAYQNINDCKILFISSSEKDNLDKILSTTTGKPILTISDSKGFGQRGVIINMYQEGNFIRYEVNKLSLEKSGLKISSLLLNYAVIIGKND